MMAVVSPPVVDRRSLDPRFVRSIEALLIPAGALIVKVDPQAINRELRLGVASQRRTQEQRKNAKYRCAHHRDFPPVARGVRAKIAMSHTLVL